MELLEAIASSNTEQKISLLPQALEYGELGIDFLIDRLGDRQLEVRVKAYELLQGVESEKVRDAIAPGLFLNPGDRIYSVYLAEAWFTDDGYCLCDDVEYLDGLYILVYGEEDFDEDREFRKSKRLFCYLNLEEAEHKAETLHRKLIQNEGIGGLGFEWYSENLSLEQWCIEHIDNYDRNDWQNRSKALDYLYLPENIELLSKFWKEGIGHFAFVKEEFVRRSIHIRIGESLTKRTVEENMTTEFIAKPRNYETEAVSFLTRAWKSDRSKLYLLSEFIKYGELGIDFLIDCLSDRQLEVRAKAYELLQGVESEKVKDAIASGLLLNPGDKIYSVYQAIIWFTDTVYLLFDDVDYLKDLKTQIYGEQIHDDEDLMYRSERIFCYVDRDRAEHKAEVVHRNSIQQTGVGIGGFEWQKENQNFDLKQWCLENDLISEQEWNKLSIHQRDWIVEQLIRESRDRTLQEKYSRSKYIYKPEHIDTWCKDNQVTYDRNLDNWVNYRRLVDYLRLPENIELLSKFWKDGIGHMAFVKEEIVQQTTYVKIGKKLDRELGENKLFAVPKEFEAEAAKLLVKIIDSNSDRKTRSKAREMLQENDWNEIPF